LVFPLDSFHFVFLVPHRRCLPSDWNCLQGVYYQGRTLCLIFEM
jgi:hypothetical protein